MKNLVTEHLSSGIDAKDAAVPQPSGSTKECSCFPVDIEDDSDDEEEDSDADISSGSFQDRPRVKSAVHVCILLALLSVCPEQSSCEVIGRSLCNAPMQSKRSNRYDIEMDKTSLLQCPLYSNG